MKIHANNLYVYALLCISVTFEFLTPHMDSGIIFAGALVARAHIHLNFQAGNLKLKMSAEPGRK